MLCAASPIFFEIAHDRILRFLVVQECNFIRVSQVEVDALYRFNKYARGNQVCVVRRLCSYGDSFGHYLYAEFAG